MKCSRCLAQTEVISEYYDFNEDMLVRDTVCTRCNSVLIEKFYRNDRYISDWIDLSVKYREK